MGNEIGDHFEGAKKSFREAVDFGLRVSKELNGQPATDQSALASMVHTKMCVNGASVQHMFAAPLKDHSTIIAQCRMIMEAATLYLYLMETIEKDEWDCRYLCLKLHDTVNRIKFMRGFNSGIEYVDLIKGRDSLQAELTKNEFFKTLPEERRKELLTGQHLYLRGVATAVTKMGWNFQKYLALYSYFSAHSHSAPMSFFRMRRHKINFADPSEAQQAAMVTALSVAEYCLIKSTLHYLNTSPEILAKFDANELATFKNSLAGWKKHFER